MGGYFEICPTHKIDKLEAGVRWGEAVGLLLVAAVMKAGALLGNFSGSSQPDEVLWFLPANMLAVLGIGLEAWMGSRLLSGCFLDYRGVDWLYFGVVECGCFGLPQEGAVWSAAVKIAGFSGMALVFLGSLAWKENERSNETVNRRGFTLIELLVVIAMIGLLAGV